MTSDDNEIGGCACLLLVVIGIIIFFVILFNVFNIRMLTIT